MKTKKTVEEAIKQGLKIGDEVWVKGEVLKIGEDVVPLCLGFEKENRYWFKDGDEIYLPTDTAPEWLTLAECEPCVGDVLELILDDKEVIEKKVSQILDGVVYFGAFSFLPLSNVNKFCRVKSRAVQPEQWQPKEGELVWHKFFKFKVIFLYMANALGDTKFPIVQDCDSDKHVCVMSELEPYDNQDTKIDFSVAGQWLRNAEDGIVCTFGELSRESESIFLALPFGAEFNRQNTQLHTSKVAWQLLAPEQMKPILELIANI